MAQKQWVWNKWYGGLSDNTAIVSSSDQSKFSNESYAVDGRKNPEGLQLLSYVTSGEDIVIGNITCYLDLSEFGSSTLGNSGTLAVTDTGRIYVDGDYKDTVGVTPEQQKIRAVSFIGADVYLLSQYGHIHKYTPYTNTATSNVNTFPVLIPADNKPIVYKKDLLIYIGSNYNLYTFDGITVSASPVFKLDTNYKIVGITFWQSYMNVYGTNTINGIKAMWLPKSGDDAPSFTVPYNGKPILGVSGEGGIDVAVMGSSASYSDLYALQGTSLPQLLVSNTEGNVNVRTFNGIITTRNGITYLGGTINGNGALFSYGKYINGFPSSLQADYIGNTITAILIRESEIKFGNYKVGDTNPYRSGVIFLGHNTGFFKYTDNGEVVSLPFTGGKRSLKNIIDVEVCFKTDSLSTYDKRGGNVIVFARTTPSSSWTTIRTINTTIETEGFIIISQQEMGALASFNQLEWKLRLESAYDGSSYSISPLITSVTTRYDDGVKGS